jgi:hypothetical protein
MLPTLPHGGLIPNEHERFGSPLDPVMKLDANGRMLKNFGGGLVNWPHGFYVDRAGDVWVTDGR